MKKFAALLMILSVSVFTVGCSGKSSSAKSSSAASSAPSDAPSDKPASDKPSSAAE